MVRAPDTLLIKYVIDSWFDMKSFEIVLRTITTKIHAYRGWKKGFVLSGWLLTLPLIMDHYLPSMEVRRY